MDYRVDMTTAFDALQSLEAWLNINSEDMLKYVSEQKQIYYVDKFLGHFNIDDTTILRGTLYLASLHVTTNNDSCESIKEFGLINLQDTIRMSTPFGNYIRQQGILIDIDAKAIEYKGKTYDIGTKTEYATPGSKEYKRNAVIRKLYNDYQINGFFSSRNALRYGGGVCRRPEFLGNLAALLGNQSIEYDWVNPSNKCYVLKYYADIEKFEHYTFDVKVRDEQDYQANKEEFELQKRKWLIINALTVIFDDMFDSSLPEFFSYAKFETKIPFEDIEVFTAKEYIEKFKIKD